MTCNEVAACIKNNLLAVLAGFIGLFSAIFIGLHILGIVKIDEALLDKIYALLSQAVTVGLAL